MLKSIKRGLSSLRSLQWKLTLSYTLVTIVALLVLELILIGVVLVFLNSGAVQRFSAQGLRDGFGPQLEPYLSEDPPNVDAIENQLGAGDLPNIDEDANFGLTLDQGYLFVLDEDGMLLASNPRLERYPVGESFDPSAINGLSPLLNSALDGDEALENLSTRTEDDRVIAVSPIKDGDEVVGAVAGVYGMPSLAVPTLVVIGVSVVVLLIPAGIIGAIFGLVTSRGPARRLQNLAEASEAWSKGDFSVLVKDASKDEIGQLSRDLNHMAAELENLIEARQELATLETRNRFARDLHDSVKQQVFATSLQVAAAKALIARDAEAAENHLSQAEDLAHGAQKELNVLIHEMRPAALEGRGLSAALRDYVKNWSQRSEIEAGFHIRGEREVSLEVEQALFRVAQEALANAAKHSHAKWVEVEVISGSNDITLRVSDDGRGFDTGNYPKGGFGLESMSERAERFGGSFEVESKPGQGTRIVCVFPTDTTNINPTDEDGDE